MFVDTKETSFLHDLSKPSLEALSYLLRHKEMWPKDFVWHFGSCSNCAMGLANQLWSAYRGFAEFSPSRFDLHWSTIKGNFPPIVVEDVLFGGCFVGKGDIRSTVYEAVTPEMVADKIDEYIELHRV